MGACLLFLILSAAAIRADPTASTNAAHALIARRFVQAFEAKHLSRRPFDAAMAATAWTNYLRSLNPEQRVFNNLKKSVTNNEGNLAGWIRNGDLSAVYAAFDVAKSRRAIPRSSSIELAVNRCLDAIAHSYDPHSGYIPAGGAIEESLSPGSGAVGLGAILGMAQGRPRVDRLVPGSPAANDKRPIRIKPGDWLIAAAEEGAAPVSLTNRPLSEVIQHLRGSRGSVVRLTVLTPGKQAERPRVVELTRAELGAGTMEITCAVRQVADDNKEGFLPLGYLRLPVIGGSCAGVDASSGDTGLAGLVRQLQDRDVAGILLDLRGNPGGDQNEAVRLMGVFISNGPVLQTGGRDSDVVWDDDPAIVYDGPLVVLVNRLTASSAELIAATLQDYGRAVVVGDSRTYGKGTCQQIFPLGRSVKMGSARITTEAYYRISGQPIQGKGMRSDIVLPSPWEWYVPCETNALKGMPGPPGCEWSPVANLTNVVKALKAKSLARRVSDREFKDYVANMERLRIAYKQNRHDEKGTDVTLAGLSGGETDMVLDESLRILRDLAAASEARGIKFRSEPRSPGFFRRIRGWFGD